MDTVRKIEALRRVSRSELALAAAMLSTVIATMVAQMRLPASTARLIEHTQYTNLRAGPSATTVLLMGCMVIALLQMASAVRGRPDFKPLYDRAIANSDRQMKRAAAAEGKTANADARALAATRTIAALEREATNIASRRRALPST